MGRVTFSNELNDFVKAFGAGATIAQNAEENKVRQQRAELDAKKLPAEIAELEAKAKYYGRNGVGERPPEVEAGYQAGKDRFAAPAGDDRDLMIRTIYGEAGGEGPEGQAAVANVIKNRLAMGQWGHSLHDVIMAPKQFSLWNSGDPAGERARALNPNDPAYKSIAAIVDKVQSGELPDITGGATHYYNPRVAHPDWGDTLAKDNDLTIGNHRFVGRYVGGSAVPIRTPVERRALPVQAGADGGMIRYYAEGGMVDEDNNPNDADDRPKPYYVNNLMDDVGNALGKLGEVITGGLKGLQEKFGLGEQPAVAQADPGYQTRVSAFARNEGAPPPEQIQQIKHTVDPDNQLGDALGTTYGMVKAYEYYLTRGDMKSAQAAAASVIQYTKSKSQQLGALAVQALQAGDTTSAAKALQAAFNLVPNGQEVKVEGNKAIIIDQKTGKVVKEATLTPDLMMNAAMGFTDGSAFLNTLNEFAVSEKEKVAEIKAGSALDVANVRAGAQVTAAAGHDEASRANTQDRVSAQRDIAAGHDETSRDNTTARTTSNEAIATGRNESNERIATGRNETSRANTQDRVSAQRDIAAGRDETSVRNTETRTESNERIATGRNDTSRANTQDRVSAQRDIAADRNQTTRDEGSANRASREGVAARGEQGKDRRQAVDLDFRGREGAANRSSREGIAADRDRTSERNTDARTQSSERIASDRNRTTRDEGAANRYSREDIAAARNRTTRDEGAANRTSREGIAADRNRTTRDEGAANRSSREGIAADNRDAAGARQALNLDFRGREGAANRSSREGIAADNRDAAGARQAIQLDNSRYLQNQRVDARAKIAGDRNQLTRDEGAANRSSRESVAAGNRTVRASEGAANRSAAMERTQARGETSTRNTDARITAAGARQDKAISAAGERQDKNIAATGARQDKQIAAGDRRQERGIAAGEARETRANTEYDRRRNVGRLMGRETKELDRINKMDDFAIMGVDPTVTQKVSASQAQTTRNIARGIVEAGGRRYGDQGVDAARKITAYDPKARRPVYDVRFSQTRDGYTATLPDGTTVPMSEGAYQEAKSIRDKMSGAAR